MRRWRPTEFRTTNMQWGASKEGAPYHHKTKCCMEEDTMKLSSFVACSALALYGLLPGLIPSADAATRDVPTQYANIFNAIAAAQSGDEIRVANNYAETEAFLELTGKNVTIRSYLPNFSAPAPGATWNSFTDGDVN